MKRRFLIPAILAVLTMAVYGVWASGDKHGGDITFSDTKSRAPVIFSHDKHMEIGNQCGDCHDTIFQKKKGSSDADNAMTMKSMAAGKFCGACHDGEKAFKVRSKCKTCHVPA